jgi:hypothetical protein
VTGWKSFYSIISSTIVFLPTIINLGSQFMSKKETKNTDLQKGVSRRQFAKTLAIGIATAAPLVTMAQTPTPMPPKESPAPPKPDTQLSPTTPKPSSVVEAYTALAIARFGERFNEEQMKRLKQDIEGLSRRSDRLTAIKLQNGEEPDFVFAA